MEVLPDDQIGGLVSYTGVVTALINSSGGGSIFKIDSLLDNKIVPLKVKADFNTISSTPRIGEVWQVVGSIHEHESYGEQLIAAECNRTKPIGSIIIKFLASNNKFAGIGDKKAKKLWTVFGEALYCVLDQGDIASLTSKSKGDLAESLAINLCEVWQEYSTETPVIQWLQKHEFPTRLAAKILDFWGANAISSLTDDPFKMLAFDSWKKVDSLAAALGIAADDQRRIAAAIEATAYERYDRGNTACAEKELLNGLFKKTGIRVACISDLSCDISDRIVAIDGSNNFQSIGAYALELIIRKKILHLLNGVNVQDSFSKPRLDQAKLKIFESTNGISLSSEQKFAISCALSNQISCITGGAGVGKTTILKAIFDQIGSINVIYQVALTGRAAKRMMEATCHEAKTISSFILRAADKEVQENSYLFIDESSMVDTPTLYRLLKVLPSSTTICFVGDSSQLPPIGPGLPFHKLVENTSSLIPVIHLNETHRFANESGILPIANAVRNQSTDYSLDDFRSLKVRDHGVSFTDADDARLRDATLKVYREFAHHGEAQIIAPTNKVCDIINGLLHNENFALRQYKGEQTSTLRANYQSLTIGDKILYKDRNDYSKELYNGSLGILLDIYAKPVSSIDEYGAEHLYVAEADFDDGNIVQVSQDDLNYISLGYCITVPKSQGSQFERVVFVCPETNRQGTLDNALIYTAVTRAKKQVAIIGGRNTFEREAKSRPRAFNRLVGLAF